MLSGLYSAASAMNASAARQDIISRNLAHSTMPGFRRSFVTFESFGPSGNAAAGTGHGSRASKVHTDFSAGPVERTGRPLDLAIAGDAFFTVDGPDGPLYTRNGVLHRDADGQLVTVSGYPLAGVGNIPATVANQDINITANGTVIAGGAQVGQLQLASFADKTQLEPVGTTLFANKGNQPPGTGDAVVEQGAREKSNVNSVTEMVQMLMGMRHHEANSKAVKMITEAIQQHTSAR